MGGMIYKWRGAPIWVWHDKDSVKRTFAEIQTAWAAVLLLDVFGGMKARIDREWREQLSAKSKHIGANRPTNEEEQSMADSTMREENVRQIGRRTVYVGRAPVPMADLPPQGAGSHHDSIQRVLEVMEVGEWVRHSDPIPGVSTKQMRDRAGSAANYASKKSNRIKRFIGYCDVTGAGWVTRIS